MSIRKNHNSIIFLTTLGVYLGLVLVGAPSGVFVYPAATTRNFDISDEIEFTENFDNDPDTDDETLAVFDDTGLEKDVSFGGHFNIALYAADTSGTFQFSFDPAQFNFGRVLLQASNPHFDPENAEGSHPAEYNRTAAMADNIRLNLGTHLARSELGLSFQRA